jgi:hypothetical protein
MFCLQLIADRTTFGNFPTKSEYIMRAYPKYSALVCYSYSSCGSAKHQVDGRITVSSESVCQAACSWVGVGSFHKCLVVRFKIFTASVRNTGCPGYRYTKIHAYVLVPKSFIKFIFSTVYRVSQKDFYARPYTSIWAPDLRQHIIEAVELITPHMLINTWQQLEYR